MGRGLGRQGTAWGKGHTKRREGAEEGTVTLWATLSVALLLPKGHFAEQPLGC